MPEWMSRHKWLLIVGAAFISLLIFAACNGDDDDGDGVTPADGEPPVVTAPCEGGPGVRSLGGGEDLVSTTTDLGGEAPQANVGAQETLKIGVLVPSTGTLSTFGPDYINAANLAAKCINNAGGVNGAAVEIVEADTGTAPEQGVTEADRLVNVEGVVAILGAASSAVSLAVAESVTVPAGVLQISPASTSDALTDVADNDFLFRMPISDEAQGVVLANLIFDDLGLTSVCDLYVNNAYGQGLSAKYREVFEGLGGTVTASIPHDDVEAVSYISELTQCTDGDPEALVAISYPTGQATVYLREALEQGLIDTFVFVDGTKEDQIFIDDGWENFDGMFGTAAGVLPPTDFNILFDEAFTAEYGVLYQTPFVRESYDAIVAMALAAARAGTNTDSAAIRDALREVGNAPGTEYGPGEDDVAAALTAAAAGEEIDYQGASGSVNWDENGDVLVGGIEVWRVDAATETLITERNFKVDLVAGTVEEAE